jgi:Transposase IS116/IS110/IS902 family
LTQSKMRSNACPPREATRSHRAGVVHGASRGSLSGDARRVVSRLRHLVPAESSTGDTIRRKGLTLAGNRRARRALVEAAWTYRYPARVSDTLRARLEGLPKPVRDIAWKAQVRLCARYRRLSATGKKLPIVVAAIAREMAAFLWAIGREVAPA